MTRLASLSVLSALSVIGLVVACGGQEPPPKLQAAPPVTKDPAWLANVSQTCARVASCTRARDTPRLRDPGACVDWWLAHGDPASPDPLQKCLGAATTCEQVATCMHGGGDARAAQFCAQRPGVVSGCDGDRLVSCSDDDAHESTVLDCATLGATCRETKSAGGLVTRGCFAPQKCPPGAPEARCDGASAVLSCHDGAVERATCAPGTRCEEHKDENAESTASCQLPGRPRCNMLGARRCEGDRLVECSGSGHYGRVRVTDCVGFGLRCAGTGPRASCYVPNDVECGTEMLPKCEGASLVFCAAGRVTKVSCAALGMSTCDPTARGAVAACAGPAPSPTAAAPVP
jgi:hypothetical protein